MLKWTINVLIVMVALSGSVFADDHLVTTEKLSVADVKPFTEDVSGKKRQLKLLGIHQEGNSATVYYQYPQKGFAPHHGQIHLVRFTSGTWYCPEEKKFLTKD